MPMPKLRVLVLTTLAMLAFAGNSLLCRLALKHTGIDAASFTSIRLLAGAIVLTLVVQLRRDSPAGKGNWYSALALFAYAAGFSFAYLQLPASAGALLLFSAVQGTMISYGLWQGERLAPLQIAGFLLSLAGLVGLLLPGLSTPPLQGSLLMIGAGIAWGIYSLRGKGGGDPTRVTAGNFLRAAVITVLMSLLTLGHATVDNAGFWYAVASGALTSGLGYAIWYTALPALKATTAAAVQVSVPVLAAMGGVLFLDEHISLRLMLASAAILGGVALTIHARHRA